MCRPWANIVKRTSAAHVVYLNVQESEKQQNKEVEQVLTKIWGCVTCVGDEELGGRDESKTLRAELRLTLAAARDLSHDVTCYPRAVFLTSTSTSSIRVLTCTESLTWAHAIQWKIRIFGNLFGLSQASNLVEIGSSMGLATISPSRSDLCRTLCVALTPRNLSKG